MDNLKRRDFLKIARIAAVCPTQLLDAKPKMIKAYGITLEGSTTGPIKFHEGGFVSDEFLVLTRKPEFICEYIIPFDTKGYDYLKIDINKKNCSND